MSARPHPLLWPVTAGLAWAAGWLATRLAVEADIAAPLAVALGFAVSSAPVVIGARLHVDTFWRRVLVAAGYPALLLASGLAAGLPGWLWAIPFAGLVLAYPVSTWHDAPVFPTPRGALAGLPARLALPAAPRLHDAGCGLGHGLQALRAAWPDARLSGVERSWPLRLAAALRCPWADVTQGDMWRASWSGLDAVYLFQRPESMARALAKAEAEMAPGTWLLSLEFEVPGRTADLVAHTATDRPVHAYRIAGRMDTRPKAPSRRQPRVPATTRAADGTPAPSPRLKVMGASPINEAVP
jgi:hypothetical protein